MADQQNPFAIDNSGPFADYLQFAKPQPITQGQQPAAGMGKVGTTAFFLDKFIEGAQQGTYKRQQQELMKQRQSDQTINQFLQLLDTKDPVAAEKVRNDIITQRGQQAMSYMDSMGKGKKKDGQDSPHSHALEALKNIGTGMLGGKVEKWKGYGDKMGEWATAITTMPSKADAFQRDSTAFGDLTQQITKEKQQGDPDKVVHMDDLTRDPRIVKAKSKFESLYGTDPTKGWDRDVDPTRSMTPYQKNIEALKESALKDISATPKAGTAAAESRPQMFGTEVQKPITSTADASVPAGQTPRSPESQLGVTKEQLKAGAVRQVKKDLGITELERVNVYNSQTHQSSEAWRDPIGHQLYDLMNSSKPLGAEWGYETQPKADKEMQWKNVVNLQTGKQQGAWVDPESKRAFTKVGDKYVDMGNGYVEETYRPKKEATAEDRAEHRQMQQHIFSIQNEYLSSQRQSEAGLASELAAIDRVTEQRRPDDPKKLLYPIDPKTGKQPDVEKKRADAEAKFNRQAWDNYYIYNQFYQQLNQENGGKLPPLNPPPGQDPTGRAAIPPPVAAKSTGKGRTAPPPAAATGSIGSLDQLPQ